MKAWRFYHNQPCTPVTDQLEGVSAVIRTSPVCGVERLPQGLSGHFDYLSTSDLLLNVYFVINMVYR
jgi:hypothetical protein